MTGLFHQLLTFDNQFEVEKSRKPALTIFDPYTGQKDWYHMVHLEGANNPAVDRAHHVKNIHYGNKGIYAITRFADETVLHTGYKNKIVFHYVASAELGGADGTG